MMETLTLSTEDDHQNNLRTLHVAAAGVLDNHHHHHSPVDEDQMMNISDMSDLPQEIHEEIVTMPMAKEMLLITLVEREQSLYNPKDEHYRNVQRKDMKWLEIAEHVGWSEAQCKAKWKALRDQYCRELKRSKFNIKANVKWKYYKELEFLRPFALARHYRPRVPPVLTHLNNNNNNNSFNISPVTSVTTNGGLTNVANDDNNVANKITTIKIESSASLNFGTCDFSSGKSDNSNNLTEEQLTSVLQQQTDDHNWTYITTTNNTGNSNNRLSNHSLNDTQHLLSTHHQENPQQTTDEAIFDVLVDCMGMQQQDSQQQQQEPQQTQQTSSLLYQTTPNNEEEDDDPIHTFLNIESYFEQELIGLIRNEDMLYNYVNPNYRNIKLKLEVWDEIARKLKKTVKQCRLKWKALRDQFIREHKRLKNRHNVETLPRWKHYDALNFLQKFIKHKTNCHAPLTFTSDFDNTKNILEISKTKLGGDIEDEGSSSPLRSPGLQPQSDPNDHLCVSTGSVGGYDDMDIDNYILGDSGSVADEHNEREEEEPDTEDRKSQQDFSMFSNHNTNISNDMAASVMDSANQAFKEEQNHIQQQQQVQTPQQQHIDMPSLDINDASQNRLMNINNITNTEASANNNISFQQQQTNPLNPSNNNITLNSAVTALDICTTSLQLPTPPKPPPLQAKPLLTAEASTNTYPLLQDNPSSNNTNKLNQCPAAPLNAKNNPHQEDDEVGAFFKSVAMKIRNANLSQVALTDLEIEILRVINTSLRNH